MNTEWRKHEMTEDELQLVAHELWASANELRSTVAANEFKNYILPLLFYRYLSERQEQYLVDEGIISVPEGMNVNDAYRNIAEGDLKAYLEDIAKSLSYAIAPQNTWTSIMEKINKAEFSLNDYQSVFNSFNQSTSINTNSKLKGTFDDVNLGASCLGASIKSRTKTMNAITKLVDSIDDKDADGTNILGNVYECLIAQFAATAGKKDSEFYTPHEISQLMAKLITAGTEHSGDDFSVYDLTMGTGSSLLAAGGELPNDIKAVKYYGQELNPTSYNIARMNLMMHGVDSNNMVLNNSDTLATDWPIVKDDKGKVHPHLFDAVVADPPYSAKWDNNKSKLNDPRFKDYGKLAPASKADYAFILHGLYHLKDKGTMAVVLPYGVLFRENAEKVIRTEILEKNYLDAVIGLPPKLLYGPNIPLVILVFKKGRQNKDVFYIDASREFKKEPKRNHLTEAHIDKIIQTYRERKDVDKYAHVATPAEFKKNDFNLNIPRYVDTFEPEPPVDLEKLTKEILNDNIEIKRNKAELNKFLEEMGEDPLY